tara:strand:- start:80 stop:253 length:174 start_codon:yes stop_codon:yes gene_type:complete
MGALEALEEEQRRQGDKLAEVVQAQALTAQRLAIYLGGASVGTGGLVALVMKIVGGE